MLQLETELKKRSYRPGEHTCFVITDPKPREVWAANFRDRVVHHLLIANLEPIWEKKFIFHSFACRKNKGAHKGVRCLKKTLITASGNSTKPIFFLQADIYNFFVSIDKQILFSLIKKNFHNRDILWLCQKVLFQNPTHNFVVKSDKKLFKLIPKHKSLFSAPPGKGLPIGNLTSQFFANLYLNELDQFAKHKLKSKWYFRYMDDFVLLHNSKKQLLLWRKEIAHFLQKELKLKLHSKKQVLQPAANGVNWLGYIVKPDYILSRKRVVSSLKRKLFSFNKKLGFQINARPEEKQTLKLPLLFPDNLPSLDFVEKARATVNSYYGHFQHGSCFNLRKQIYYRHFRELQSFLCPASKDFSHFIIKESYLNLLKQKKENF